MSRLWVLVLVTGCGRVGFESIDSTIDANLFFGEARCPVNVLFCDDFEASQLNTQRWQRSQNTNGTFAIDSTHSAARGARSLRFTGDVVPAGTNVTISVGHQVTA